MAAAAFLTTCLWLPPGDARAAADLPVVLNGLHKYQLGDDPAWALREHDDRAWPMVEIPSSFFQQGVSMFYGTVWYRIRCTFSPTTLPEPALYLGRLGDADEVYVNGVRIGETGIIGDHFVSTSNVYRLYHIPLNALRADGNQVIALRLMSAQYPGGFYSSELIIDSYDRLLPRKQKGEVKTVMFESSFLTGIVLLVLLCIFLYMEGVREREYAFLSLYAVVYGVFFLLDSSLFSMTGLKTPLLQRISFSCLAVASLFLVLLVTHACRRKAGTVLRALVATLLLIAILYILVPFMSALKYVYMLHATMLIATAVYCVAVSFSAYRRKEDEAGIILLGVTGYVLGSRTELIGGITVQTYTGLFLIDYSTWFFLTCMVYAMASRYVRVQANLRDMRDKVLDAHEEERRRIARDLHDGVGQSLLALKLQLQMLSRKSADAAHSIGDEFGRLVNEITGVIEEVRQVSMSLRPSFLETVHLADSIAWHVSRLHKKTGIEITPDIHAEFDPPVRIKDNVYRMYQESMANIVKHAQARSVRITLITEPDRLFMEIIDDGVGFDNNKENAKERGIGFSSMRERALLIGGRFAVSSVPGGGTCVTVEVEYDTNSSSR